MNKLFTYVISAILFLSMVFQAFAQTTNTITPENNLCKLGYSTFFINGVTTEYDDALKKHLPNIQKIRLNELKQLSKNKFTYKGEDLKFGVLYNPTHGFLKDLLESRLQKKAEQALFSQEKLELALLAYYKVSKSKTDILSQQKRNFIESFNQEVITKTKSIVNSFYNEVGNQADVTKAMKILDADLFEKRKVVIISHSQGNLFSQQLFRQLKPEYKNGAVKWVHVATPASSTINGAPYITNNKDVVIGVVYGSLPSNHTISNYLSIDPTGHGFSEIYLNPLVSQVQYNAIIKAYENALNTVIPANTTGRTGAFTVGMTWDGLGDVDLHVVEPNNNEVYFSNQIGSSGELDTDNTYENGPEHYSASCDAKKVQEGTYQVFAKNYSGANGRIASVLLKSNITNLNAQPRTIKFSEERKKLSVFNIKVTNKLENGKRIFKVNLM